MFRPERERSLSTHPAGRGGGPSDSQEPDFESGLEPAGDDHHSSPIYRWVVDDIGEAGDDPIEGGDDGVGHGEWDMGCWEDETKEPVGGWFQSVSQAEIPVRQRGAFVILGMLECYTFLGILPSADQIIAVLLSVCRSSASRGVSSAGECTIQQGSSTM